MEEPKQLNIKELFKFVTKKAEEDCRVDVSELDSILLSSASKRQEYISLYHRLKNSMTAKIEEHEEFKAKLFHEFVNDPYLTISDKQAEAKIKLNSKVIEQTTQIAEYKSLLAFIADIMENLKDRGFQLKTYVEYLKIKDSLGI